MTIPPELQQKAQQLRQQAQTGTLWIEDGYNLVHLVDAVVQAIQMPAPDFTQIGEQLTSLAETVQAALPDNLDAAEALQPLLETIGDLLGSLGDISS